MARKRLFNLALILLLVFGVITPALDATSRTDVHAAGTTTRSGGPAIVLSLAAVTAGDTITVSGHGFLPADTISLGLLSLAGTTGVKAVTADDSGAFSVPYTIPTITLIGMYVLIARGLGEQDSARAPLAVLAATPSVDGQQDASATPTAIATPSATSTVDAGSGQQDATSTATSTPSATSTSAPDSPTLTVTQTGTPTATSTPAPPGAVPTGTPTDTTSSADVSTAFLAASPATIRAGDFITVTAGGFPRHGVVDVTLLGGSSGAPILLASLQVNGKGRLHATKLAIPISTPAGAYALKLTAQDGSASGQTALMVLARTASIAASPSTFSPQSTIAISGAGFVANEQIAISLDAPDGSSAVALGEIQANVDGIISPTAMRVPFGAAPGQWLLQATGAVSNLQATFPVSVNAQTPTLRIEPATAAPGTPVTVLGAHFQPREAVAVDLVSVEATIHLGNGTADAYGTLALTGIRIPTNLPSGAVTAVATGSSSHLTATAQFNVIAPPTRIAASRTNLRPGTSLLLAGSGFIAGETVNVVLDGDAQAPLALAETVADGSGAFVGMQVVVPGVVPAGSYMLTAAGLESGRQAAIRIAVQAPRATRPLLGIVAPAAAGAQGFQTSPGALVQVAGSHFPPNTPVALQLVSSSGQAAAVSLGHLPGGLKIVGAATSAAGARRVNAGSRPVDLPMRDATAQSGAAMAAGAALTAPVATLATVKANANGSLGPVGVALPATLAAGSYTVQAVVGRNHVAATLVRLHALHPQLALSTRALVPGSTVTVHGAHFAPGEQIVLALNSQAVATSPRTVLADRSGTFTAHFVAPSTLATGSNAITASGTASRVTATAAIQAHLPPSAHWYFADGDTTRGHGTTIALLNPNARAATVRMTFLYQGSPARNYTLRVRARAHTLINLALAAGSGRRFSTILDADQRIGAESAVAYAPHILATTLGASAPANQWYMAEGYTGGSFQEYLQIMNPNSSYATVDARFLPFNGRPARNVRFVVRPRSAIQVNVRRYMPLASVGSIVTADKGIVVSRTMRFGTGSRGAHQSIGSTQAATVWLFGQGNSSISRQTFLTVANLNQATSAIVTATFLGMHGQPLATRTIFIQPLRRGNIKLNDVLPQAQTSVVITSNVPVVAERSQYDGSSNLNHAYSGSVLLGSNSGSNTWLFPNASTAPSENTQIYLFNPSLTADHVLVTFYTDGGRMVSQRMSIPVDASTVIDVSRVHDLSGSAVGVQLSSSSSQVFVAEQAGDNSDFQSISANAGIP